MYLEKNKRELNTIELSFLEKFRI